MLIKDKEYELIQYFNNVTLEEILNDLSGVASPSKEDLEVLEYIKKCGLPKGVLNVLIYYVMFVFDTKLSKSFIEKIVIEWSRKNINTPMEAIGISRMDRKKYQLWAEVAKKRDREAKQPLQLNKVDKVKLKAIERAAKSTSMSDADLGRFVREMFKS
ncbi:DnaD domain protein [Metabacillus halosaccharovorans]|uniref:DnaD domain protein n=1 Tax=Metabacillus halosaccharovorans TaxID=930124 RepID=UPI00203FC7C2|nr:DnaD domain protein [Metabacillus halosaccharovorans]MCM3443731.1 DnaD domain protein [Metabacillus halosaccharovorans]